MKIGDEVFVRGCVDEIRKDVVIVKNEGGYFGTVKEEIGCLIRCKDCKHWLTVFDKDIAESGLCNKYSQLETTKADDYCSRAESKEE